MNVVSNKCLIFDAYGPQPGTPKAFGLMAAIEIFRSEMDFAREAGGRQLLDLLNDAGHYPYSDLDREPVA